MLRHLVFLDLKDDREAISTIRKLLANLCEKLDGCNSFNFGRCENIEYHYFFMDFDSKKNLDLYLSHPEHQRIAQEHIIPNLKNGLDKSVIIFDYKKEQCQRLYPTKNALDLVGYVLLKGDLDDATCQQLTQECGKISSIKPLQNRSQENIGQHYPYALKIRLLQNVGIFKPMPVFWTREAAKTSTLSSIKSKL